MSKLDLAAHRPRLHRFVIGITGNAPLSEDVVQKTLLRALKSATAYSGQAQIGTWLAAIALNVLRDHYRASRRTETGDTATMLAGLPAEDDGAVLTMMKDETGVCITGHVLALPGTLNALQPCWSFCRGSARTGALCPHGRPPIYGALVHGSG